MKAHVFGLVLIMGALVGSVATMNLRAQSRPKAYVIIEVDVTNPRAYFKEYAPLVGTVMQELGGKPLARGGETISFQGAPPRPRAGVFEFESLERARFALNSQAYREAKVKGEKYASFRIWAIEGQEHPTWSGN
jgi:uncharacterized protein (DUF1330 family)